jgi:hypothetical protein
MDSLSLLLSRKRDMKCICIVSVLELQ